jgi:hypothetical protein
VKAGGKENHPSQGMVQLNFSRRNSLKLVRFSVLLSNPFTKDEFHASGSTWFMWRPLRNGVFESRREDLQQPECVSIRRSRRCGSSVAIAFAAAVLNFQDVLNSSAAKKYLEQNPRRNPEHVIRSHGNRGIELLGPHPGCA